MNGAITTEFDPSTDTEKLAALMEQIKPYAVTDAVVSVSCKEPATFEPTAGVAEGETPLHVALLDLGCKKNIVRCCASGAAASRFCPAPPPPPTWRPSMPTA